MNRFITCLLAAAVLAGCALGGSPDRSDAAVIVGIGDQTPATFSDPAVHQPEDQAHPLLPAVERGLRQAQKAALPGLARRRGGRQGGAPDQLRAELRHQVPGQAVQAAHHQPVHEGVQGLPQGAGPR